MQTKRALESTGTAELGKLTHLQNRRSANRQIRFPTQLLRQVRLQMTGASSRLLCQRPDIPAGAAR